MTRVFFAYPGAPRLRAETISLAAEQCGAAGVTATTWEALPIEGAQLVPTICKAIDASDAVIAEVSDLNSNVLFEAGYAIARDKQLWLALDDTDEEALRRWKDLGILATIGRIDYSGNSHSLSSRWLQRQDQTESLLAALLLDGKPREVDAVFAPSTPLSFEASSSLKKHLDRQGHLKILGAAEDLGIAPLAFYVKEIYRSSACIFHLLAAKRVRAREHNARASFLAGIAYGLDLPVLMLVEEGGVVPLDYKDITFEYSGSAQMIAHVDQWLTDLPKAPGSKRRLGRLVLDVELPIRSFGAYVAEYERDELDKYFIHTREFESVLNGTTKVFVGRKGTGKTATMIEAVNELRKDRRILVVPVKPSAYELSGLSDALNSLVPSGSTDYLIISLWTYLLYTEIALRTVVLSRERVKFGGSSAHLDDLERCLAELDVDEREDMATRLEKMLADLNREAMRQGEEVKEFISRQLRLHRLSELKGALTSTLKDYDRVAVLIDNLDKAWERGADYRGLSKFILGLLVAIGRVEKDFARPQQGSVDRVNVTLTAFLRSDIYESIARYAREPDKIGFQSVHWNDEELLVRVLEERFEVNQTARSKRASFDMWAELFEPEVRGLRTRDYLLWRVLPRPRDIIYFANEALTTAINRKHAVITAADILFAEEQYSRFAVEALLVESEAEPFDLEAALFEFAGLEATFSEPDLMALLQDYEDAEYIVSWLIQTSVLGVETGPGKFLHVEGKDAATRQRKVAQRRSQASGEVMRLRVHPAMRSYLAVKDDDLHDGEIVDLTLQQQEGRV